MSNLVKILPTLLEGAVLTVEITLASVMLGILIGLIMALGKMSHRLLLKVPAVAYIEFIRGTPIFVQILLFYFGLPGVITQIMGKPFNFEPITAGILVCGINSGAYVAEIIRAGIQSIDKGQMEAARSLGMTHKDAMRYIILPQAFKVVLPPLGNEFITLMKETSILAVIGVMELTQQGRLHVAATFTAFSTYIGVALIYLAMTMLISRMVALMERRLGAGD